MSVEEYTCVMKKTTLDILEINRDGPLTSRLMAVVLIGFDTVLDKESRLYLRLLTRLVDKAFNEYWHARNLLLKEIKTKDKLLNRFLIINHLENCVGAVGKCNKILTRFNRGTLSEISISNLVGDPVWNLLVNNEISNLRNRVEHVDEDIANNSFTEGLFLDVDESYKNISINGKSIELKSVALIIENYHKMMLGIYSKLPIRMENGIYFYQ